jgi:Ni,Fe-hydrogenase maturation factor
VDAPRLFVIGCGNAMAGDDSFGVEFVRRLSDAAKGESECTFLAASNAGPELLDIFQQADVVLFADAVSFVSIRDGVAGGSWPAGTLHLVPLPRHGGQAWAGMESRGLATLSNHGWSLGETLRLAETLGRRLPQLLLLGVELEDVAPGAPRSHVVESALERAVEAFPLLLALARDPDASVWSAVAEPRHFTPDDDRFPGGP